MIASEYLDKRATLTIFTVPTPFGDVNMPARTTRGKEEWEGKQASRAHSVGLQYENGTYEKQLTEYLLATPFEVFYDVGAAYGYFSLLANSKSSCKTVVAIEPMPFRFGLLKSTAAALKSDKLFLHNTFIAPLDHPPPKLGRAINTMYATNGQEPADNYTPPIATLDSFHVANKSGVVKIDVEGYELEVLKSAPRMVADPALIFVIEIHKNRVPIKEIINFMTSHGKFLQEKRFHEGTLVSTLLFG